MVKTTWQVLPMVTTWRRLKENRSLTRISWSFVMITLLSQLPLTNSIENIIFNGFNLSNSWFVSAEKSSTLLEQHCDHKNEWFSLRCGKQRMSWLCHGWSTPWKPILVRHTCLCPLLERLRGCYGDLLRPW